MKYSVCAVICAAGQGLRASFSKNKLLVPFQGSTALEKTLTAFDFPAIDEIIVAVSPADYDEITALCSQFPRTKTVLGGDTRSQSVYNALQAATSDIALIHDGARPFVSRKIIENCIASVKAHGSGVCAVACTDTIASVKDGKIMHVPDRKLLYQIQTPQGFFRENILAAYQRAFDGENATYTDDSSVFAAFCGSPRICDGATENIKLTYPEDFVNNAARCGFGVDTHAFGKEQNYIVLGGEKIACKTGLIAHSDGDVLIHALMDAMLSAAGLRDIGYYFPDTDARFKDACSLDMLGNVTELLVKQGYAVQNVSIAVQAETPRLSPYIDNMKNNLSAVLHVDQTAIGISAGTNEGLGYVGEGKGITAYAYVLLKQ